MTMSYHQAQQIIMMGAAIFRENHDLTRHGIISFARINYVLGNSRFVGGPDIDFRLQHRMANDIYMDGFVMYPGMDDILDFAAHDYYHFITMSDTTDAGERRVHDLSLEINDSMIIARPELINLIVNKFRKRIFCMTNLITFMTHYHDEFNDAVSKALAPFEFTSF